MNRLAVPLLALFAGCAGQAASWRSASQPAAVTLSATHGAVAHAPRPFTMHASPCPLRQLKGPPGCSFSKVEDAASGTVLDVERISCRLNTQARFVGRGEATALSLSLSVVEGGTSFGVAFLRQPDGTAHVVPDALTSPVLLGRSLVGFAPGPNRLAFWKDGVCEEPDDGYLSSLAPVSDDAVVALLSRWDRDTEVLLRAGDGAWWTLGTLDASRTYRLHAQGGRVALEAQQQAYEAELALHFPELELTEVVQRYRKPPPVVLAPQLSPLPARPGSLFGDAWLGVQDGADELLLARPAAGGYEALRFPLVAKAQQCANGGPDRFVRASQPALLALSGQRALVAWVEQRGTCSYRRVPAEVVHCAPGQPCRPPAPESLEVESAPAETTLVVAGVGARVRELARVHLTTRADSIGGVALEANGQRVFVQAWGHLVQLDRSALEKELE